MSNMLSRPHVLQTLDQWNRYKRGIKFPYETNKRRKVLYITILFPTGYQ